MSLQTICAFGRERECRRPVVASATSEGNRIVASRAKLASGIRERRSTSLSLRNSRRRMLLRSRSLRGRGKTWFMTRSPNSARKPRSLGIAVSESDCPVALGEEGCGRQSETAPLVVLFGERGKCVEGSRRVALRSARRALLGIHWLSQSQTLNSRRIALAFIVCDVAKAASLLASVCGSELLVRSRGRAGKTCLSDSCGFSLPSLPFPCSAGL